MKAKRRDTLEGLWKEHVADLAAELRAMEQEAEAVRDDENRPRECRSNADCVAIALRTARLCCEHGESKAALTHAFEAGRHYERMRLSLDIVLANAVGHRFVTDEVGGRAIELTDLEQRIVILLRDRGDIQMVRFVREVWGQDYDAADDRQRSACKTALSKLAKKFGFNPFHIEGDVLYIRRE